MVSIKCSNDNCGLIWIDPVPTLEILKLAYSNYYTHTAPRQPSLLRRIYDRSKIGYLVSSFGYPNHLAKPLEKSVGRLLASLPHRRAALDAGILWLPWKPDSMVLEVGCGNGDRLALLKTLGWQTLVSNPTRNPLKSHVLTACILLIRHLAGVS